MAQAWGERARRRALVAAVVVGMGVGLAPPPASAHEVDLTHLPVEGFAGGFLPTHVNARGDVVSSDNCCGGSGLVWDAEGGVGYAVQLLQDALPEGGSPTGVTDLNDHGQMVGGSGFTAFRYDLRDHTAVALDQTGYDEGVATAVDETGRAVGTVRVRGTPPTYADGDDQAVAWSADGSRRELDDEGLQSRAFDLDEHGRAVGFVYHDGPPWSRLVMWDVDTGAMTDLSSLVAPYGPVMGPLDINDLGQVLVHRDVAGNVEGALVVDLDQQRVHELPDEGYYFRLDERGEAVWFDPPGRPLTGTPEAHGVVVRDLRAGLARTYPIPPSDQGLLFVNDVGQISLTIEVDGAWHAAVIDPEVGLVDVTALAGSTSAVAGPLSDDGLLVGYDVVEGSARPWRAQLRLDPVLPPVVPPPTVPVDPPAQAPTPPAPVPAARTPRFTG
jgi:hypothetical protein